MHRLPLQRAAGKPLSGGEDLYLHHRRGRDRRQRLERACVHPPPDPRGECARARCAAKDHLLAELCQGAAGADHHHALRALRCAGQGRAQGRRARSRARCVGFRRDAVHRADGRREGEQRAARAACARKDRDRAHPCRALGGVRGAPRGHLERLRRARAPRPHLCQGKACLPARCGRARAHGQAALAAPRASSAAAEGYRRADRRDARRRI